MSNNQETPNTTRDATDLGVSMKPADPSQPKRHHGPEDALGDEPTRGDYSERLSGSNPHQSKADPDAPLGERIGKVEKQRAEQIGE